MGGTHGRSGAFSLRAWVALSALDGERREGAVAAGVDASEAGAHGGKRSRKADVFGDAEGQGPGHLTAAGIGVAEFDSGFEVFDVGQVEPAPPQEEQCALWCTTAIDLIEVEVGTVDGFDRAVRNHEIPAGGEGKAVVHGELVGSVHRVGRQDLKRPSRCVAGFKTVAEDFLAANRFGCGHGCGEKYEGPKDRTSWFSQEGCHVHNCTVESLRVPLPCADEGELEIERSAQINKCERDPHLITRQQWCNGERGTDSILRHLAKAETQSPRGPPGTAALSAAS